MKNTASVQTVAKRRSLRAPGLDSRLSRVLAALVAGALVLVPLASSDAATVTLNLTDPDPPGPGVPATAGERFEANLVYTDSGVTFSATATGSTGVYSANVTGSGVGTTDPFKVDPGEAITYTLTLVDPDLIVRLTGITFFDLDGNSTTVTVAAGANPPFNTTTNFSGSINITQGQSITISNSVPGNNVDSKDFGIASLTFDVSSTVPEPTPVLVLAFSLGGAVCLSRRRKPGAIS